MKIDDITFCFLGGSSFVFGLMVFFSPVQKSGKYGVIDFGHHHELVGIAMMILGAICAYSVIKKK